MKTPTFTTLPIKFLGLVVLILMGQTAMAQLKVVKLTKADIPASIHYVGHVIDAVKFTDAEGEHIVITTETGEVKTKAKDSDGRDADLYAYCYKTEGDKTTLTWQVHDFEKNCEFDILVKFIPNTFAVTDLNNDGKAEVWLMYKTACTSDVSPFTMKIIMYEGGKKFAARGTAKIRVSDKDYSGGQYAFDDAFKNGPDVFRQYAEALWKKNLLQDWRN
jgi:hypothetical protein